MQCGVVYGYVVGNLVQQYCVEGDDDWEVFYQFDDQLVVLYDDWD